MGWTWRLRNLFGLEALERQIDDELAFHIAERADELVADGLSQAEARRQALIQLGNYTRQKEDVREIDLLSRLETVIRDVRYGLRTLLGSKAFTATAVLSLALGIGANTAIFSIIDALMLRSLPVADPAALVKVQSREVGEEFTNPIWEYLRDHQRAFSGVFAWSADRFDLAEGGESRFVRGLWVSGDFFRVLGVPALQGRVFTVREDRRGTLPVAVISYNFSRRNFPNDANVVGKTVHLNRHVFEVVGVTPPWFAGLDVDRSYDVAVPIACEPILHTEHSMLDQRSAWWLQIMGRTSVGQSRQQAAAQLNAYAPALFQATVAADWPVDAQKEFLKTSFSLSAAITGFSDIRARYKTALLALMGIAAVVLLITCANVANLLLYQLVSESERLTGFVASGQDSDPQPDVNFEVRGVGQMASLGQTVRSAIMSINPHLSLEFRDLATQVNESVMQPRLVALLSSAFGVLALVLAAVGLYGITAYGVSRRRNEMGIRIALGAPRWSVIWLALRDVGALLAVGVAVGLCGSLALGRFIKSLLYGVQANDPRQLAGAAVILMGCAFAAAYLPARRAASLDPFAALREE